MTQQPQDTRKRYDVFDPGFRLDSDLTVVDHLGGSRKVDIYLCRSRELNARVACKVLRRGYLIDFSALDAVMREGNILRELRHPNVVEGYRVALEDYPRVVMQYLRGQTLSNSFFQGNYDAFDTHDMIEITTQLAGALSYVHAEGLVHLDVKPTNVMYHSGHATLLDFSVADEYSPDRRLRNNAGTVEYMASEQTYRRDIGYATDVFGLGVVFYRLLSGGELPYPTIRRPDSDGNTKRELDYSTQPRPPSDFNPAVPSSVSTVALKAIEVEMADRYQTPADFGAALNDLI